MPSLSYLAVVLGALLVMTRLPGVFYPKEWGKFVKGMFKEAALLRVLSGILLVFSVSILLQKYDLSRDWETVMSVLGWVMLIVALHFAWCPEVLTKKIEKWLKSESLVAGACFLGVAVGIGLIYLGLKVY